MAKQKIPYSTLDTPVVLVDMDKLETNIREMSQLAARGGGQTKAAYQGSRVCVNSQDAN